MDFGGVFVGSSCPGPPLVNEEEESLPRICDFLAEILKSS